MPESQRLDEFDRFNHTRELFARNYTALRAGLERLTGPEAISYQEVVNRWKLEFLLHEVTRQLHNFVASANTLVDHSRRIYRKLYQPVGALGEYEEQVRTQFGEDPVVQFMHCLRNMCLHFRLPSIGTTTSWQLADQATGAGNLTIRVELVKDDLGAFSEWNAAAKTYLTSQSERIDLQGTVDEYFRRVMAFHSWMQKKQMELHRADAEAVAAAKQAVLPRISGQIAQIVESSVALIEREGAGDLKSVLAIALGPEEQMNLDLSFLDEGEWAEKALEIVGPRLRLGTDLMDRIRRVSRSTR